MAGLSSATQLKVPSTWRDAKLPTLPFLLREFAPVKGILTDNFIECHSYQGHDKPAAPAANQRQECGAGNHYILHVTPLPQALAFLLYAAVLLHLLQQPLQR